MAAMRADDESKLIETLRKIEALFAGATTEGERTAAAEASKRIRARLDEFAATSPPEEFRFTMGDLYSRRVLLALLRRYELKPYRLRGQRHTTVNVKVSKRFVDETLWPEFQEVTRTLRAWLDKTTERIIAEAIHADSSDATEVDEPRRLTKGG